MIEKLISSISVLLVFTVFFTDRAASYASKVLLIEQPHEKQNAAMKSYKTENWKAIANLIMVMFITLAVFLVFIKDTIAIFVSSKIDLISFNTLNTSFVLIEIFILCLLFYQGYWLYSLLSRK